MENWTTRPGRLRRGPRSSWTSKAMRSRSRGFARGRKMLWDDENFYVAAEMEEPHGLGNTDEARLGDFFTIPTSRCSSIRMAIRTNTMSSR
jgi:hypothetical protein